MDSFDITIASLKIVELLMRHVTPVTEKLTLAFENTEIFATDAANDLVLKGYSFREAYREVGENLDKLEKVDIQENLRSKKHIGATGNLRLDQYAKRISDLKKRIKG